MSGPTVPSHRLMATRQNDPFSFGQLHPQQHQQPPSATSTENERAVWQWIRNEHQTSVRLPHIQRFLPWHHPHRSQRPSPFNLLCSLTIQTHSTPQSIHAHTDTTTITTITAIITLRLTPVPQDRSVRPLHTPINLSSPPSQ